MEKTVSETYFFTSHLVMPRHANPLGILFGGYMIDWMIEAATLNTMRLSGKNTVVGYIDNLFFINPISIGDTVFYRTWIGRVRRRSMEVIIEAIVRSKEGKYFLASTAKMILVAVGSDGRPVEAGLRVVGKEDWELSIIDQLSKWRIQVDEIIKSSEKKSETSYFLSKHSVSSMRRVSYEDAMPANIMYAGSLLRYIDELSSILAFSYAEGVAVTASIDQLIFKKPIYVGDIIKLVSMITRTWRTSMEIKTLVLRQQNTREELLVECYSTFVKLSESGKPAELKPFEPATPEEYEEWVKADERRKQRLELMKKISYFRNKELADFNIKDPRPIIKNIV
ncbi:MAG: acyl-CoA thioesterase [Sulfolobales archaeon]